ncbi:MAG TPA: DUF4157 domain-containing protein [Methanosarcina sp.]|nr:DUF4157 domain-containing protein [Methanosarcina sp.]
MPEHQQIQQSKKTNTIFQKQATPIIQPPVSNPYSIIQRAKINPKSLTHADIMQLQRTIGNRAVGRLLTGIGNYFAAQQALVQRQEIPEEEETCPSCMQRQEVLEEEEPLQGKVIETIQRQEIPEEDEPLQGKFTEAIQRQEILEEEEPLQGKMTGTIQRQEIPEEEPFQAKRENNTGIPDNLKAGVESLSGMDMSNVRVHYNSDKPAEVGALAYTQGTDIHVAQGQEKHLPHEAWHVVQQAQGRVQATMQLKGVQINDDNGLEQETDAMGERAFTSGQDVFFRQGAYEPGSRRGQELVARELTHVVQQTSPQLQRTSLPTAAFIFEHISPRSLVVQSKNDKPKRHKNVTGKEKNDIEEAVRKNNTKQFTELAQTLYNKNQLYYVQLLVYKLKKHQNTPVKLKIWLTYSPVDALNSSSVTNYMKKAEADKGYLQSLGKDNIIGSVLPLGQRYKAKLNMGQGLVANLGQYILFSDEFSDCSPIVLFNPESKNGALFHFPSGALKEENEKKDAKNFNIILGALYNMCRNINPTEIHLNKRYIDNKLGPPLNNRGDRVILKGLFKRICPQANVFYIPVAGNQYAVTLGGGNKVLIDTDFPTDGEDTLDATHDRTGEERLALEGKWQRAPAAIKYGIDMENREDQD